MPLGDSHQITFGKRVDRKEEEEIKGKEKEEDNIDEEEVSSAGFFDLWNKEAKEEESTAAVAPTTVVEKTKTAKGKPAKKKKAKKKKVANTAAEISAAPAEEKMKRDLGSPSGPIAAQSLKGCWVGVACCILPWAANLEPEGKDAYTHSCQCLACIPCGEAHYARSGQTNTFINTSDDGDQETFENEEEVCFAFPYLGCGCKC